MALICIVVITLGSLISWVSTIKVLKLSFSTAFKSPFFYGQTFSLLGLCGLIFYGTDFFDANRHLLTLTLPDNLPALLESISKILWPVLGFILLLWLAQQILFILKNPGIYEEIAQTIFWGKNQQGAGQNSVAQNATISSSTKTFETDYQKEEYKRLETEYNSLPETNRLEKLFDFAVLKKILADFENIYAVIYGTQVSALKALQNNISLDLHSFFGEYLTKQKAVLPNQKPLSYDQWEKFIIDSGLATKQGTVLQISSKGRDFLMFIEKRHEKVL